MSARIVAMAAIPGRLVRGGMCRSNIQYASYGRASWEWWCRQNGATFVLIDEPPGGEAYAHLPPTIQRWLVPALLADKWGDDAEIAMVDADTMIRWDAPNLFDAAAGNFAAVQDCAARFVAKGTRAYQRFFPEATLPWWEHFNAGLVVVPARHAALTRRFVDTVLSRWPEFQEAMSGADVSTDQTPLNLFLRQEGQTIRSLPRAFNFLHCVNVANLTVEVDAGLAKAPPDETEPILASDIIFDFIDLAWVWHFTNVLQSRTLFMAETWRRVASHYPGALLP